MRSFLNFLGDEAGSETVQFVVWVPLFLFLLVIVTDASFLYLNHTEMVNVARDTARRMTTTVIKTEADAITYATGELSKNPYTYQVIANYDESTAMTVVISVPVVDVAVFGLFLEPVLGETMGARVVMRSEPT